VSAPCTNNRGAGKGGITVLGPADSAWPVLPNRDRYPAYNPMNKIDSEAVRARIAEVARRDAALPDAVADDVAFHMSDWLADLGAYFQFCEDPSRMSDAGVGELLTDFLIHVPNHVAAASKLYTNVPVTDIFGVGATSEDSDEVG